MENYEYTTVFADKSEEFTRKLNHAAVQGFRIDTFKYVEYPLVVRGENNTIVQSYVAVMFRVRPVSH